jgi:hypothetical protein
VRKLLVIGLVVIGLLALGVFAIPLAAHGLSNTWGGMFHDHHEYDIETGTEWHGHHHGSEYHEGTTDTHYGHCYQIPLEDTTP